MASAQLRLNKFSMIFYESGTQSQMVVTCHIDDQAESLLDALLLCICRRLSGQVV